MLFFFQNQFVSCCFSKTSFGNISRAVWIKIMPDVLWGLIWVQIVCKGYLQTSLHIVSKEFMMTIQAN